MSSYPIPSGPVVVEQKVKRSTFICYLKHCPTRSDADNFIRRIQDKHPDANHNCWACVAGAPSDPTGYGMSDDGEPKGCAGKPMFHVLYHSGVGEICVVVSRYFGGIKLGTGGMARAYSSTVQLAMEQLQTKLKIHYCRLTLTLPYNLQKSVEHIVASEKGLIIDTQYGGDIVMQIDIDEEKVEEFKGKIVEASQGTIHCSAK